MLEIRDLECAYGPVTALRGITLDIGEGELVALIGANGAGKSTTLRAISGLVKPKAGSIRFCGEDIGGTDPARIISRGIAHCPEGRRVFPYMTVAENLMIGAYLRSDSAAVRDDMDRVYTDFPRLKERRSQAAGTLSGGEQQMLAIGRAMMSRPKLMVFDEPSLGLAPTIVEQTLSIIRRINDAGTTVLLVEQNAFAALELCDHAYLLEIGRIVRRGSGDDLMADPKVRSAYLGGE
ncbi:high-affinity branched-chain amino acid transport ATP-binding protein LivF [Variibacter gotjawalensis]|uniref:High-affinity branched-chain amino acid transport ATP-binding protein LivF n=1 Tax=Variibacter gotjawalensis TaxID=1333996 RepID=A0A0S3PZQ3_9BRAD|nr:ABC transporter ATP-binding protein [Variibacter gotjawalensis]NIK47271.1 branched-chain amino acid transport system ATP-binding protein [Variibacter gotjawalensis]RZS49171.1 amino acid/amide ABC transporter ATP-binding protein 2 (HAAT family) [Variibacter gotjawalensis]BAT61433.1 high-affinity branched-chain amino acid transport ATP-binding protein LivF [Variibacter gotjawalensis]